MAIHPNSSSLLKESIPEYLQAAEYCLNFRKPNGGCLGYPGAALMFSIADSIGSYHRGRTDFTILIDGKNCSIRKESFHHFFILNSNYYQLSLSENTIKKLYENYRCLLLHNAALALNNFLYLGDSNAVPFIQDDQGVHVNVSGFLRVTREAVSKFMKQIDVVVPGSSQEKIIELKR
ncbi:MAG: hypothetical protein LHV69_11330 [Elusimicrobia bacterium]|nr:hypothetical protein [Candidatus Obscuribacterium magneticum]